MRFQTIVAVTDSSPASDLVVPRAAMLAAEHRAVLQLIRITASGHRPCQSALAQWEASACRTADAWGIGVELRHASVTVIEQMAQKMAPSGLWVVGAPPQARLKTLLQSTLTERLLRVGQCPLLIVKSPVQRRYERLLIAVDLTPVAESLLKLGRDLDVACPIDLLHVIRPLHANPLRNAEVPERILNASLERQRLEALKHLHRLADAAACAGRVSAVTRAGEPARETAVQQAGGHADLVIVGKRRKTSLADFLWGGVAQGVLAWCTCDTLVLPHERIDPLGPRAAFAASFEAEGV